MNTFKSLPMLALAVVVIVTVGLVASAPAQTAITELPLSGRVATDQVSGVSGTVVLGDLPQVTPGMFSAGRWSAMRPYAGITEEEYQARKLQAAKTRFAVPAESASPLAPKLARVGVNTPGAQRNFDGIDETCSYLTPSDMAIAVSQRYVVQVVNSCISVFNKSGVLQAGYPKSLTTFFGLPSDSFVFDPRMSFDWVSRRFVVVALRADFANSRGFLEVAASLNDDPRGGWYIYHIQGASTGYCPDFPTLGQDWATDPANGTVAVGFNVFPCNANGFYGSLADDEIYFLNKSAMYAGAGFSFNIFGGPTYGGVLLDTIQVSNVMSRSDKPRTIFGVNTFNINFGGGQCLNGCNGLIVWAFSNVLPRSGSPGLEWSGVVIGTPSNYSLPPNATQPGGANTVDTNDTRISGTVPYTGGSLWATINTNNGVGGPAILAWQIKPTLNDNDARCTGSFLNYCPQITAATIEQQLGYDVGGGTSLNAWFGTIAPDPERNITMVFAFSGTSYYPSVAYVSNRVTQAPNAWHDSGTFLRNGVAFYNQGRWGDYTGIANDLLDVTTGSGATDPSFWFSGQYVRSDGLWGTAIGKNGYVYSNQP